MNRCFCCCTCPKYPRQNILEIRVGDDMTDVKMQTRRPDTNPFYGIVIALPLMSRGDPKNEKSRVVSHPKYWNPYKHQPAVGDVSRPALMLKLDGQPIESSDPGPARGVAEYMELMEMTRTNRDCRDYRGSGLDQSSEHGEVTPSDTPVEQRPEDKASDSKVSGLARKRPEHGEITPSDTHVSQPPTGKDSDSKVTGLAQSSANLEMTNLARQVQDSHSDCEESAV